MRLYINSLDQIQSIVIIILGVILLLSNLYEIKQEAELAELAAKARAEEEAVAVAPAGADEAPAQAVEG